MSRQPDFQICGPTTGKARLATVDSLTDGTTIRLESVERREALLVKTCHIVHCYLLTQVYLQFLSQCCAKINFCVQRQVKPRKSLDSLDLHQSQQERDNRS